MDDYLHLRCANDCVYVFSRFREPVLEQDWRTSHPFLSLTPADVETGFRRLANPYTDPDGRDFRNLWQLAFFNPHTLPAEHERVISELTGAVVREELFGYKVYDPFWFEPLPDDSIPAERPQPEGTEARRHWLNEQLIRLSQWQDSSMGQFDEVGEDPATPELLRFAVAFLKTPAKLGTGLVSDIAGAGLLLTDEATREAFVESIVALYEDPDRLDAIIDRFWDQPGYEIVSDLFAFSGELIIPLFAAGRVARVAKGATLPETPAPRHVDGGGAPIENARDASQGIGSSAREDIATVPDGGVGPNTPKQTGARSGELGPHDWDAAESIYDAIRKENDVEVIAQNTGMQRHMINRIKNHLFFKDDHIKWEGLGRMDADPLIANAWRRLQNNGSLPFCVEIMPQWPLVEEPETDSLAGA